MVIHFGVEIQEMLWILSQKRWSRDRIFTGHFRLTIDALILESAVV